MSEFTDDRGFTELRVMMLLERKSVKEERYANARQKLIRETLGGSTSWEHDKYEEHSMR